MILKECPPALRGRFVTSQHVFADTTLGDLDAEFEQFAKDAGCTPSGILPAHLADQMRTSREMTGRPSWPRHTFQVQKRRKPARCQATTVSGLTMASAERQSRQRRERQIHKRRSPEVNFGRFAADL
jgi:hypothetical protein